MKQRRRDLQRVPRMLKAWLFEVGLKDRETHRALLNYARQWRDKQTQWEKPRRWVQTAALYCASAECAWTKTGMASGAKCMFHPQQFASKWENGAHTLRPSRQRVVYIFPPKHGFVTEPFCCLWANGLDGCTWNQSTGQEGMLMDKRLTHKYEPKNAAFHDLF